MRTIYLIAYDICCDKRYRKIYPLMCGAGEPLQYSVFRCPMTAVELQLLKDKIWPLLKLDEDRMMIVDLGPSNGRGRQCIECWGQPLVSPAVPKAAIV